MILPEFVDNPENRCPVVLLLDVSKSMAGDPIRELNAGIAAFKWHVQQDELAALRVEVAVIAFGGRVEKISDFVTVDRLSIPPLEAAGDTPMGAAINLAIDTLEARKAIYRDGGIQYYRPWLFLITDGEPSDRASFDAAAQRLDKAEADRRLSFFAVGVQGAKLESLQKVCSSHRPPLMLRGLDFRALFEWLSASVRTVSRGRIGGDMIQLPPVSGWAVTET